MKVPPLLYVCISCTGTVRVAVSQKADFSIAAERYVNADREQRTSDIPIPTFANHRPNVNDSNFDTLFVTIRAFLSLGDTSGQQVIRD